VNPSAQQANEHLRNREFEHALRVFDEILNQSSDDPTAHHGRGEALFGLDRHSDAIEAFSESLRLRPENLDTLRARGIAHFENNNESAIDDLNRVIQQRPDDALAWCFRGASSNARAKTISHSTNSNTLSHSIRISHLSLFYASFRIAILRGIRVTGVGSIPPLSLHYLNRHAI